MKLDWFANPEPDVAGYKIYYGGRSGNYTNTIYVGKMTNVTVVGLISGATYYFVATAYNTHAQESPPTAEITYTVPVQSSTVTGPLASTASAIVSGPNSAVLNGSVDPNGARAYGWFEYGLTTGYGVSTAPTDMGAGTSALPLSRSISGLQPGTTYHFRCVASNALGFSRGSDYIFSTPAIATPPSVTTLPATVTGSDSATLNGLVNPNGTPTMTWFECGLTTSYGVQTTPASVGNGATTLSVNGPVSGLIPGVTYHFRIVSSNSAGISRGVDMTFATTAGIEPMVSTLPVVSASSHDSILYGSVTPGDFASVVWFEYGTTPSLGNPTPVLRLEPGHSLRYVTRKAPGLRQETTYYYRVVASTSAGTVEGDIQSFSTPPR